MGVVELVVAAMDGWCLKLDDGFYQEVDSMSVPRHVLWEMARASSYRTSCPTPHLHLRVELSPSMFVNPESGRGGARAKRAGHGKVSIHHGKGWR